MNIKQELLNTKSHNEFKSIMDSYNISLSFIREVTLGRCYYSKMYILVAPINFKNEKKLIEKLVYCGYHKGFCNIGQEYYIEGEPVYTHGVYVHILVITTDSSD